MEDVVVITWTRDEALKAKDQLDKLNGRGKHCHSGNICWNDGIFAMSIVREYGMSCGELQKIVNKVLRETKVTK
jgi:hypothetical protein